MQHILNLLIYLHRASTSSGDSDSVEETVTQFNNKMASCLSKCDQIYTSLLRSTDDVEDRIQESENNLQAVIQRTSDTLKTEIGALIRQGPASSLQTQYSVIITQLKSVLTCKICHQFIQGDVAFLQCCSQIAGCGQCVETWFEENDTCPLCRDTNGAEKVIPFRGLDDLLNKMKELDFTLLDA